MIESRTCRPMTANETEIARLIWLQSREHPVSVRDLAVMNDLEERDVKRVVCSLRTKHLLPIGASRMRGHSGYWWAVSAARLAGKRRVLENAWAGGTRCRSVVS